MKLPMTKKTVTAPTSINELLGEVDAMRDQVSALRADRAQIESAPRPLPDVLSDLDQHLDQIATSAVDALNLHHLRDRRGMTGIRLSQSGSPEFAVTNLLGLVVATNRAAVRDLIANQLSDLDQGRPGMAEADRLARLAEIDKEILAAELAEEGALRALELQGVSIGRRADASPLAVLAADAALVA